MRVGKYYKKLHKLQMKHHLGHCMDIHQAKTHHNIHHHGYSSSSRSSSTSGDDEAIIEGFCRIHIGDSASRATPPDNFGDICKWKLKYKKNKYIGLKRKHKIGKCELAKLNKLLLKAVCPEWKMILSTIIDGLDGSSRDHSYDRERFSLPPPEMTGRTDESRNEEFFTATQDPIRFHQPPELGINGKLRSEDRNLRQTDSVELFMQSIAEQVKKMTPKKMAEAKYKVLEVIHHMQLSEVSQPSSSVECMRIVSEQDQEQ